MTALLLVIVVITCLAALFSPAYGVIAYYALAVAHPQGIWPWIFQDLRITFMVTIATILGALFALLQGRLNLSALKTSQAKCIILLTVLVNLSHWFSPFPNVAMIGLSPAELVAIFNKVILFYLIAIVTVQTAQHWRMLLYTLAATALYYTYWANSAYLTNKYWLFGDNGRLAGPGGMYVDENGFALIFIVGFPVVYYLALMSNRLLVRYSLFASVPLMWHALLLTGSRGALLSVGLVGLYIAYSMKSKTLAVLMLLGAAVFIVDQGGNVINRIDDTIEIQQTEADVDAINPRMVSWQVGFQIIADYPILGVGAGKYRMASPQYREGLESVAHNTFLQFAANSGLLAGVLYLMCFYVAFKDFRIERQQDIRAKTGESNFHTNTRKMMTATMIGFLTASIFLNLMIYEILYLLLILYVVRKQLVASGEFFEFRAKKAL